jgi:hypothetical protein
MSRLTGKPGILALPLFLPKHAAAVAVECAVLWCWWIAHRNYLAYALLALGAGSTISDDVAFRQQEP